VSFPLKMGAAEMADVFYACRVAGLRGSPSAPGTRRGFMIDSGRLRGGFGHSCRGLVEAIRPS